jgi:hypothetical protein
MAGRGRAGAAVDFAIGERNLCGMRASILAWLFPLGALVTVVLVSLFPSLPGSLLAVVWGWVLLPAVVMYVRSRGRARSELDEIDAPYWRIRPR